ncbi:hypothetical protein SELMODRAFT_415005 [Selaginella moellendorffii]|uniref:Myb-like domain-containing protein n=1 Tax=Selaginella moellendorffii TaxID=88036 RepID=D8RUA8_SELML|nr:hypothetical protein SELMODRAFT_415005 [Selaginella moellendorffii]
MREARLWDLVASRMSFQCSGRECEREWRALVSRYEEKGLQEGNASLFEEIDAIFKSRGEEVMVFTHSEEESVSIDSHEDGESEAERDVQQVLEDMFHRMPCVPPGWLWQEGMMAKEKNGDTGLDDEEHHPALSSSAEASTQCKQEGVEERMPRWGHTETKDFISIRADMEEDPSLSSQKNWWDPIAGKMRERGYARTSEQCKRKWKKLVSRYKVSESMQRFAALRKLMHAIPGEKNDRFGARAEVPLLSGHGRTVQGEATEDRDSREGTKGISRGEPSGLRPAERGRR